MIFGLTYIPNHGVYRLHEAFDHFIQTGCDQDAFSAKCFPDWFASVFQGCPKLRDLSEKLWTTLKASAQDLTRVRAMWNCLSNVDTLCCDCSQSLVFDQPSNGTTAAIRNLFDYLYEDCLGVKCCKTTCGDIAAHYAQFVKECATICPFCGLEAYRDLDCGYRAAYDHYLCRSRYPLLAVCFRNLVPICRDCNEPPQKGSKDMLRRDGGGRRKAYYPFGQVGGVTIGVKWTVKPSLGAPGKCELSICPKVPGESEQVDTWITVYRIKERAAARIQVNHDPWLRSLLWQRYHTKPTVAQLRTFFNEAAARFSDAKVVRSEANALYKHGLCVYLANESSDAELEGIASIAAGKAVNVPIAVG